MKLFIQLTDISSGVILMVELDFEEDDPIWDIIRRYGITSNEIRQAILAWAYTIARQNERDEVWNVLNEGFRLLRRRMMGIDPQELRRIYHV